jgi:signal transduction histidine kinase
VLDLNELGPLAGSIELPPGGSLTAFETDGRVLARFPEQRRDLGRSLPEIGVIRAGREDPSGAREAEGLDGVKRVYGFDRVGVGGSQIVVAAGLSKARAQAAADRTLRRTLLTLFAVALIVVAFVLFAADFIVRPIRALAAASRRIAAGDLRVRSGVKTGGEVGELAAAFDEMADALETRERQLDRSAGDRQRLLAELIAAEEEERKRIAGDIHDDSIQVLSALMLRLEIIESRMEEGERRDALAESREAARDAVSRLRHLVFKLSPPALETAGLVAALEIFVDEITRVWGPAGSVQSDLSSEPSPELRALIYRIASEAMNNAAKHAQASRIALSVSSRDGGVWMRVDDDGVGFDVEAAQGSVPGHIGLVSMRERTESAGGWWRVTSQPGKGTSVEFWLPDRNEDGVEEPVPAGDGTATD